MKNETTLKKLNEIYSHYERIYGKNSVQINRKIAKEVSNQDTGRDWTWRYFLSLRNGTMKPRKRVSKAIAKYYLLVEPKPPPRPDQIAKRTLVIHATLDELHRIQSRYEPRKRTEKLNEM